jgi:hypothetical protein
VCFSTLTCHAERFERLTQDEPQFYSACNVSHLIEPIVKNLPIQCYVHDIFLPDSRIKNTCLFALKLNCNVLQSPDGPFISFTGVHLDVSWVLHALTHTENSPNGLLSIMKNF